MFVGDGYVGGVSGVGWDGESSDFFLHHFQYICKDFERAQVLQRCSTGFATLCSSGESMQTQWLPCSICLAAVQAQSPQELLGRKEKYALLSYLKGRRS